MTNQKNVKNTKIKPTINMMILTTVAAIIIMTKPTNLDKNSNRNSYENTNIIITMKIT